VYDLINVLQCGFVRLTMHAMLQFVHPNDITLRNQVMITVNALELGSDTPITLTDVPSCVLHHCYSVPLNVIDEWR